MTQMTNRKVTPGQLVDAIADVLGVTKASVIEVDRRLSDAGLRTKSGRGKSAAAMSAKDAANLLIGICMIRSDTNVVDETINTINAEFNESDATPFDDPEEPREAGCWYARWSGSAIFDLPPGHTFGDLLTHAIQSAMDGSLNDKLLENYHYAFSRDVELGRDTRHLGLEIDFHFSRFGPRITLEAGYGEHRSYSTDRRVPPGDLQQSRGFTLRTVETVGALLGDREVKLPVIGEPSPAKRLG